MSRFDQLARALVIAGAPAMPSFMLVRQLEPFEVEFAALEFEEAATLPMIDSAVLSLVRALEAASPRDVDAYLGLGEHVSKELILRLIDEKLLERVEAGPTVEYVSAPRYSEPDPPRERDNYIASLGEPLTAPPPPTTGVLGFIKRLFGKDEPDRTDPAPSAVKRTSAPTTTPERLSLRVYELAKQLGHPNKDLIAKIRALGIEVNNHMTSLDPDDVARIRRSIQKEREARESEASAPLGVETARVRARSRFESELERARARALARTVEHEAIAITHRENPIFQETSNAQPDPPAPPAVSEIGEPAEESANALYKSLADAEPKCSLTTLGRTALELGKVSQRRRRPMRLIFSAAPLLFLTTADEKRARYSQHVRAKLIQAAEIPPVFRRLDDILSLAADVRARECGIEASVPGIRGTLTGVVPGEQWEVRPTRDRSEKPPLLIIAAFATKDSERPAFRTYTRFNDIIVERDYLQPISLLPVETTSELLETSGIDVHRAQLQDDGAFRLESHATDLDPLVGDADEAQDVYLESDRFEGWSLGTRVHGVPADDDAARAAFFEYLSRRDASLRQDFDRTCNEVRAMLLAYWEREHALPTSEEAAGALWERKELRTALCMRRLKSDLVTPYVGGTR